MQRISVLSVPEEPRPSVISLNAPDVGGFSSRIALLLALRTGVVEIHHLAARSLIDKAT